MRLQTLLVTLVLCGATGPAAADGGRDPWEGFNRSLFAFNEWFDRYAGKPVARAYQVATPAFADRAVTAFFHNLGDVTHTVNFALQGETAKAANAAGRVFANSTVGIGGLFDVASAGGLPRNDTDFGRTLGHWGVGSGPYLVLPFLGPSTLRDASGVAVDWAFDPLPEPWTVVEREPTRYGLELLYVVDRRADLLQYEQAVIGDRYVFLRDIYLQHRDFDINGAPAADPFLDEESDE